MITERLSLQKGPTLKYRAVKEAVGTRVDLPQVNLYCLNTEEGQMQFLTALQQFPKREKRLPWQASNPQELLTEALANGILVDRVDLYLEDDAKLKRPKGYFDSAKKAEVLERYKKIFDQWEHSTIVEYPWEQRGRFVRIPHEEDFYRIAFSRNNYIFSPEVQKKLRETKFAVDGLGVGTSIAYLLVLSGAQNFTVVDGGTVNLHDHNRLLGANISESGLNHAIHWSRLALKANPYLNIDCYPQNLGDGKNNTVSIAQFLDGVGVVIEEADELSIKVGARIAAKQARVPVVMGTDLGKDGLVQYETPDPADALFNGRLTSDAMKILQDPTVDFTTKTAVAVDIIVGRYNIPSDYLKALGDAAKDNVSYWPQVGVGAFASARGVVRTIIDLLDNKPIESEKRVA